MERGTRYRTDALDSLSDQLDIVIKKLEEIGKNDPRIQRIQTIPGVCPRTAESSWPASTTAPLRKRTPSRCYFGLVPRQYQSGETDRNGSNHQAR